MLSRADQLSSCRCDAADAATPASLNAYCALAGFTVGSLGSSYLRHSQSHYEEGTVSLSNKHVSLLSRLYF